MRVNSMLPEKLVNAFCNCLMYGKNRRQAVETEDLIKKGLRSGERTIGNTVARSGKKWDPLEFYWPRFRGMSVAQAPGEKEFQTGMRIGGAQAAKTQRPTGVGRRERRPGTLRRRVRRAHLPVFFFVVVAFFLAAGLFLAAAFLGCDFALVADAAFLAIRPLLSVET